MVERDAKREYFHAASPPFGPVFGAPVFAPLALFPLGQGTETFWSLPLERPQGFRAKFPHSATEIANQNWNRKPKPVLSSSVSLLLDLGNILARPVEHNALAVLAFHFSCV
jgi:hypothetical protein